jgi:hypothetical protein
LPLWRGRTARNEPERDWDVFVDAGSRVMPGLIIL